MLPITATQRIDEENWLNNDLTRIHRFFAKADEVYRELRGLLIQDPIGGSPENNPKEWIPISKH
jgi:hypothetical protein